MALTREGLNKADDDGDAPAAWFWGDLTSHEPQPYLG